MDMGFPHWKGSAETCRSTLGLLSNFRNHKRRCAGRVLAASAAVTVPATVIIGSSRGGGASGLPDDSARKGLAHRQARNWMLHPGKSTCILMKTGELPCTSHLPFGTMISP